MKKLTVGLVVILSGYAANSFAFPYSNNKLDVSVPSFCGGFTVGLTGFNWRPAANLLDYSLTYPTITPPSSPLLFGQIKGRYHSIEPHYNWGFKAEVGYVLPCSGNDINLVYTDYDQDDRDSISGAAISLPTLTDTLSELDTIILPLPPIVVNFLGEIAIILPGSTTPPFLVGVFTPVTPVTASADAHFEYRTWDLEFGQHMNIGCNLRLRWFGGLRYSDLEHKLNATYASTSVTSSFVTFSTIIPEIVVSGTIPFSITATLRDVINQKSDFNGIGPRFGLDATYHLAYGFGIVSSLSTSLLIGEIDSTFTERVTFDASAVVSGPIVTTPAVTTATLTAPVAVPTVTFDIADFKHPDETRVVPNFDAKVGLDYSYNFCNRTHTKVVVEAGWLISHYFNVIDRLSSAGSNAPEIRSRQSSYANFDGPYVGIHINI